MDQVIDCWVHQLGSWKQAGNPPSLDNRTVPQMNQLSSDHSLWRNRLRFYGYPTYTYRLIPWSFSPSLILLSYMITSRRVPQDDIHHTTSLLLLFQKPQHNRLRRLGIQSDFDLHFLASKHLLPIFSYQFYTRKCLKNTTDQVLHLHPGEVAAKTNARSMVERQVFPRFWGPAVPA